MMMELRIDPIQVYESTCPWEDYPCQDYDLDPYWILDKHPEYWW